MFLLLINSVKHTSILIKTELRKYFHTFTINNTIGIDFVSEILWIEHMSNLHNLGKCLIYEINSELRIKFSCRLCVGLPPPLPLLLLLSPVLQL